MFHFPFHPVGPEPVIGGAIIGFALILAQLCL